MIRTNPEVNPVYQALCPLINTDRRIPAEIQIKQKRLRKRKHKLLDIMKEQIHRLEPTHKVKSLELKKIAESLLKITQILKLSFGSVFHCVTRF